MCASVKYLGSLCFLLLPLAHSWAPYATNTRKAISTRRDCQRLPHSNHIIALSLFSHCNQNYKTTSDSCRKSTELRSNRNKDINSNVSHGIYRVFAEEAWKILEDRNIIDTNEDKGNDGKVNTLVPSDLAHNDAPAKGPGDLRVKIQVEAADSQSLSPSALRLARFALLETIPSDASSHITNTSVSTSGIHVLNFVIFPKTHLKNVPIFGADLVTLPGNKHLIVIDFQPFLTTSSSKIDESSNKEGHLTLPNALLFERLQGIHKKHVLDNIDDLPWGGDIPPNAKRFFSPYALWTRLGEKENALEMVQTKVYDAFLDYLDLYIDVLTTVTTNEDETECKEDAKELQEGHLAYLDYRRTNDPARPMLKSLYGEEWTERLISEVLFHDF